jgi:hypothetical protein
MKLSEFVKKAQAFLEANPQAADLPVYAAEGASGVVSDVGSISLQDSDEPSDYGLPPPTPNGWVQLYIGN